MQFFYNWSTKTKLLFSFGLLVLFLATIVTNSVTAAFASAQKAQDIDYVLTDDYMRVQSIQSLLNEVHNRGALFLNPADTTITTLDAFITSARPYTSKLEEELSKLNENFISEHINITNDYRQAIIDLKQSANAYLNFVRTDVFALYRANKKDEALYLFLDQGVKSFGEVTRNVRHVAVAQNNIVRALAQEAGSLTVAMQNGTLGVIAIVISVILTYIISKYFLYEITFIRNMITRIGNGELNFDYTSKNQDEFGECINTLNRARQQILDTIKDVDEKSKIAQNTLNNVIKVSYEMGDSVTSADQMCISVASASTEMVSTTQEIAKNCESAAEMSDSSKQITNDAVNKIRSSVVKVKAQSDLARNNAEKIEGLAEKTRDISSIVNTIEDIASQTNLLALNAAIEAARAGEAGRGFAVVADEVRALASRTANSTQEIVKMVQSIQNEVADSTESIKESVENMDLVAEEVTSIESIMQEITSHVNDVNMQITQIAAAAEEQTSATGEISNNMSNVTAATQQISGAVQDNVSVLSNINQDLKILDSKIAYFKI